MKVYVLVKQEFNKFEILGVYRTPFLARQAKNEADQTLQAGSRLIIVLKDLE